MLVTNSIRIQIEYAIVFSSQSIYIYIYNALTLTNINQDSSASQFLFGNHPSLFILLFPNNICLQLLSDVSTRRSHVMIFLCFNLFCRNISDRYFFLGIVR